MTAEPAGLRAELVAAKEARDAAEERVTETLRRVVDGGLSITAASQILGISRPTAYKLLNEAVPRRAVELW